MTGPIALYWWSERHIQKKEKENYGDLLGVYLVEKISGQRVQFYRNTKRPWWQRSRNYFATVGSIINHLDDRATVWGSGIMQVQDSVPQATFLAVRGPLSRKRILKANIDCPEVYGDPAILLPLYYQPEIKNTHELGIIPHINDLEQVKAMMAGVDHIKIIDFNTNDVEATTSDILSCNSIISSSLHGLIVAHSYGIPAVQVKFSNRIFGDGIKYLDYYQSVGIEPYQVLEINNIQGLKNAFDLLDRESYRLPDATVIKRLQLGLLEVCPFIKNHNG